MPRSLVEAPWPQGSIVKWWINEVFQVRRFENYTDYPNLIDIRRFFWSARC